MKNLFTILLTVFAMNVFAQNGNMTFFTEDNENFTLLVNGITINTIPSNNVRADNRPVARYKVMVKFQKPELGNIIDNVYIVAGNDKTFVIKPRPTADIQAERVKNMKNPKTKNSYVAKYAIRLFSSNPTVITTQVPPPDPGYNNGGINPNGYNSGGTNNGTGGIDMNVNPNGTNINTGTNDPLNPNLNININPNGVSINGGGINLNANGTGTTTGQQSSSYSTTTTTTTTTSSGTGTAAGTWSGCAGPLNNIVFQTEERKVRNQTTEAGKIITVQQLSTNHCLTAAQIKTLCTDIFQERDRLAFAEYAYPRCYDPTNYTLVYAAFYIDANVQELNRFVTAYSGGAGAAGYNTNPNNGNTGYNTNNGGYNTNTNNGYNNGGGYVPGYNGPYGCPMPMNGNDFNTAKESIRSKTFESTKLEIAKQVTDANCFTAQQIKELVQVFEFEATKLEYAKYAFPHCYDKNNYYKVNDAFTFEASMTELSNFVKGK